MKHRIVAVFGNRARRVSERFNDSFNTSIRSRPRVRCTEPPLAKHRKPAELADGLALFALRGLLPAIRPSGQGPPLGPPLADHGWPATRLYVDCGTLSRNAAAYRSHSCERFYKTSAEPVLSNPGRPSQRSDQGGEALARGCRERVLAELLCERLSAHAGAPSDLDPRGPSANQVGNGLTRLHDLTDRDGRPYALRVENEAT